MANNLWEIVNFDDLTRLLRNSEKKFLVLAVLNNDTKEHIRIMIRKFMKDKSKIYSKVTFLIYKAQKNDFGKMDPLLDKDQTKYPKIFHIYDVRQVLSGTMSIDNKEILEDDFKEYHEHYLKGVVTQPQEDEEIDESSIAEPQKQKPDDLLESSIPASTPTYHKDPQIEKLKHDEKMKLLIKAKAECVANFIEECAKRKNEEEKGQKKKEKEKQK